MELSLRPVPNQAQGRKDYLAADEPRPGGRGPAMRGSSAANNSFPTSQGEASYPFSGTAKSDCSNGGGARSSTCDITGATTSSKGAICRAGLTSQAGLSNDGKGARHAAV